LDACIWPDSILSQEASYSRHVGRPFSQWNPDNSPFTLATSQGKVGLLIVMSYVHAKQHILPMNGILHHIL
jgi:hypothetical protein